MVHWKCAVPGCKSKKEIPGHFFPKNVSLCEQWKKCIKNPYLTLLSSQDLRKYRVCFLHFQETDYIATFKRRRLKDNAIPSLLLNQRETSDACETVPMENFDSMSEETTSQPIDLIPESNCEDVSKICNLQDPTDTDVRGKVIPQWTDLNIEANAINRNDVDETLLLRDLQRSTFGTVCEKVAIENVLTKFTPDWNSSASLTSGKISTSTFPNPDNQETSLPTCSNLTATESSVPDEIKTPTKQCSSRPLLGDITRKNKLTPVARRLMGIAEKLKKSNNKYIRKYCTFKQRLAEATDFVNSNDMKELKNLNPTQRRFFEMQLRNVSKKPQVNFLFKPRKILNY